MIHVETTEAGGLKSEDSAGDVPIDRTLASVLRGFRARAQGQFVIEEGTGFTASKPWGQRYRCEDVFYRLTHWLRKNGVEGSKPLHTLRKEAGSIIATKAGIHAASQFLRHADIQVTAMHYADHKERVTVDLGAWLKPENVIPMSDAQGNTNQTTRRLRTGQRVKAKGIYSRAKPGSVAQISKPRTDDSLHRALIEGYHK